LLGSLTGKDERKVLMARVLALQAMNASGIEFIGLDLPTAEASTSSYAGCVGCSSYSESGCRPPNFMVAV
jgi:hypothetical protein